MLDIDKITIEVKENAAGVRMEANLNARALRIISPTEYHNGDNAKRYRNAIKNSLWNRIYDVYVINRYAEIVRQALLEETQGLYTPRTLKALEQFMDYFKFPKSQDTPDQIHWKDEEDEKVPPRAVKNEGFKAKPIFARLQGMAAGNPEPLPVDEIPVADQQAVGQVIVAPEYPNPVELVWDEVAPKPPRVDNDEDEDEEHEAI